jgi:hypothetical protein
MSTTVNGDTLDDLDRQIILFVARFKRPNFEGPTWNEVRAAVGVAIVDYTWEAFASWWADPANRCHLEHLDPELDTARKRYRSRAYRVWRSQQYHDDPFKRRLKRLRALKYVHFSDSPRSLTIGPRVREWQQRRQVGANA